MRDLKKKDFKKNVALYKCEDVVALKNDRNNSLGKFTVMFWNIRGLSICSDLVPVICSIKTQLGKNTFFLLICIYTETT